MDIAEHTLEKGIRTDTRDGSGNLNIIIQAGAVERPCPNAGQLGRKCNLPEVLAIHKSFLADAGQAVRQGHLGVPS